MYVVMRLDEECDIVHRIRARVLAEGREAHTVSCF